MSQLSEALEKLGVLATSIHTGEAEENKWKHDTWKVEIAFQGRRYTCEKYKTGLGLRAKRKQYSYLAGERVIVSTPKAPSVADVIHSLISDANSGMMSFDDFCGEFGYDTDSRKALTTWEQCVITAGGIKRLLGEHFDKLAALEH